MITKQQIEQIVKHIDHRKAILARLSENPAYQDYLKIKNVMTIGQFTETAIQGEQQMIDQLSRQATQMINQQKQEMQLPPLPPIEPAYDETYQEPQHPQPQQPQRMAPRPGYVPPGGPRDVPRRMPPLQPQKFNPNATAEEDVQAIFQSKKEDTGIDEQINFEGLPEFEDDQDLQDAKKR